MRYIIRTYRNGVYIGSVPAVAEDLDDAEREAVRVVRIRGEELEDVFYPPGESKVCSTQKIDGKVLHFTRTVKPVPA